MPIDQLLFVGLSGLLTAFHRDSGEVVWSNDQLRQGAKTLLLDGDRLIVASGGWLYCVNPQTGKIRWAKAMHGWGSMPPVSLASVRGQGEDPDGRAAARSEAEAVESSAF